jgi:hypothetical protein
MIGNDMNDEQINDVESCGGCKFYFPIDAGDEGFCRRYPPTVLVTGESVESYFVDIGAADWCGEWRERK